jgi:sigma-E factor negative regulatory protein RseC
VLDTAKVVSVKENNTKIIIMESGGCGGGGGCSGCHGCGTSVIDAINTIGAKIGQDVKVEFKSAMYLKSAALVYGLPLVLFIIGVVLGISLFEESGLSVSGELIGAAFGTVLWIVSYFIIRFIDKKFNMSARTGYEIIEIIK